MTSRDARPSSNVPLLGVKRTCRDAKVLGKNEVLEVRKVDGRLHAARKERRPDQWDPPIEPYGPYDPGDSVTRHGGDEAIDD